MFYTYIIRCEDNSLYTGITNDIERRYKEHLTKNSKCAKYTKNHSANTLEAYYLAGSRELASQLEYHIKKLSKAQKEDLITKNNIKELLGKKIKYNKYLRIK